VQNKMKSIASALHTPVWNSLRAAAAAKSEAHSAGAAK
jgi:hypothetical protein